MKNKDDFILSFQLIMCCIVAIFVFGISIDTLTLMESIETYENPCIDNNGYEFVDEMCDYRKTCSLIGIMGDTTCLKIDKSKYRCLIA